MFKKEARICQDSFFIYLFFLETLSALQMMVFKVLNKYQVTKTIIQVESASFTLIIINNLIITKREKIKKQKTRKNTQTRRKRGNKEC